MCCSCWFSWRVVIASGLLSFLSKVNEPLAKPCTALSVLKRLFRHRFLLKTKWLPLSLFELNSCLSLNSVEKCSRCDAHHRIHTSVLFGNLNTQLDYCRDQKTALITPPWFIISCLFWVCFVIGQPFCRIATKVKYRLSFAEQIKRSIQGVLVLFTTKDWKKDDDLLVFCDFPKW